MLNRQEKILMFVNSMISIALALAIVVPWSTVGISKGELIVKTWVFPLIALVLYLVNLGSKYRNYRPSNRYATVTCYMPLFSVIVALLVSSLLLLMRSGLPYTQSGWFGMVLLVAILFVATALFSHFFYRAVIVFTKNEMMLIDAPLVLLFLGDIFFANHIGMKYNAIDVPFSNQSIVFVLIPLILGMLLAALHVLAIVRLYVANPEYQVESKEKLVADFMAYHKKEYDKAELHILQSLYTYSKGQLGIYEATSTELEELKTEKKTLEAEIERLQNENTTQEGINREKLLALQERLAELQIVLAEVQVQYAAQQRMLEEQKADFEKAKLDSALVAEEETEDESVEEDEEDKEEVTKEELAELEAFRAEQAAKEAAKLAAAKEKKKKKFKPSYEKIVNYASSLPNKEVRVVANEKGTQHKFYLGKKVFLITLATNNDYRVTFCSEAQPAFELIVDHPGIVVKPTSPKGEEWFRIVNKGEQDEKLLKAIIKNSAKYIQDQEIAKQKAIEEEKARKQAEKEAAKAALKAQKEAEKAALKAQKEAEKVAAKEAAKQENQEAA